MTVFAIPSIFVKSLEQCVEGVCDLPALVATERCGPVVRYSISFRVRSISSGVISYEFISNATLLLVLSESPLKKLL